MKRTFVMTYPSGMHARPSTALYHLLKNFDCKIWINHRNERVDAKNVIGVLSLGVQPGNVEFEAEGTEAETALNAVGDFIHTLNTEHHW